MENKVIDEAVKWWSKRIRLTNVKFPPLKEEFKNSLKEEINKDKTIPNKLKEGFYKALIHEIEDMKQKECEQKIINKIRSRFEKYVRNFIQNELYEHGHAFLATDETRQPSPGFGLVCYQFGLRMEEKLSLPRSVQMFVSKDSVDLRFDEEPYMPYYNAEPQNEKPILLPSKFDREI